MTEQQKPKPEFDNDADLLEQFNGEYTELFDYLADKYGFDIREDILKGEFDPDEYLDGGKFDLDEYVDEESHQFDLATESDLSEMKHVLESFPGPIKTIIAHAIDNGISATIPVEYFVPVVHRRRTLDDDEKTATVEVRLELREDGEILDISIIDHGPGIPFPVLLRVFRAGNSPGNGIYNRNGIGLKLLAVLAERALEKLAGHRVETGDGYDRGNAFELVTRNKGNTFRVSGPVDDLNGEPVEDEIWEDRIADHHIGGNDSGTVLQFSLPFSATEMDTDRLKSTVDHLREHWSLRYSPILRRDDQTEDVIDPDDPSSLPGSPDEPRDISIWVSWEDHAYQAGFNRDKDEFEGCTHAGATRLEPFFPQLINDMVGWSDKVGSIPFEGTQEIEVRTEDTDELIGRYQMIWKISVKSIRDTIRKHATTEQGGDAFNGRATYENGIKLLHGDEEPSIRNYYNPGDDDTIFIILGGQILEVDGAQYLLEDEDPQTDHQEYNYLGGWIELIPLEENNENIPERASRDGIMPDSPLFTKVTDTLQDEVEISVLKAEKARHLARGETIGSPDDEFHDYLGELWKMTMYKPLCRIGYYAYDSFEAPCPLRTGEADAVAYLADDPVQPKDTPIDGDVDIIEMKTEHIDSDTIGNRAWKYTVGQELDENDVNRVVIYTTGIREKAKVKATVQKLQEDYGITVRIYSIGALFEDVDDLEEALDEYNKGLKNIRRDELDTLFSDEPGEKSVKQFL